MADVSLRDVKKQPVVQPLRLPTIRALWARWADARRHRTDDAVKPNQLASVVMVTRLVSLLARHAKPGTRRGALRAAVRFG